MNIEIIGKHLAELESLVEGWSAATEIAAVEREIALDRAKALYEELRFGDNAIYGTLPQSNIKPQVEEEDDDESEIEVEITYYDGDDEEEDEIYDNEGPSEEEEDTESAPLQEEIAEPKIEPAPQPTEETEEESTTIIPEEEITISLDEISIVEEEVTIEETEEAKEPEPTPQPTEETIHHTENALFDLDTIPTKPKSRRSAIMSLYNGETFETPTAPEPTPQPDPIPEPELIPIAPEPIVEQAQTEEFGEDNEEDITFEEVEVANLYIDVEEEPIQPQETAQPQQEPATIADILGATNPTIADMYSTETTTLGDTATSSSSINDKFIIAQELFGGNIEAYESFIEQLEEFDNFDDCVIYITENYDWDPNNDAVKKMLGMLESKYLA